MRGGRIGGGRAEHAGACTHLAGERGAGIKRTKLPAGQVGSCCLITRCPALPGGCKSSCCLAAAGHLLSCQATPPSCPPTCIHVGGKFRQAGLKGRLHRRRNAALQQRGQLVSPPAGRLRRVQQPNQALQRGVERRWEPGAEAAALPQAQPPPRRSLRRALPPHVAVTVSGAALPKRCGPQTPVPCPLASPHALPHPPAKRTSWRTQTDTTTHAQTLPQPPNPHLHHTRVLHRGVVVAQGGAHALRHTLHHLQWEGVAARIA
jgi:hypothetical protein